MKKTFALIIVLLVTCSPSMINAGEIDGYRGAKWGMTKEEVRGVIEKLGLEYINRDGFQVKDKIFGGDAQITYLLPSGDSLQMVMVRITKSESVFPKDAIWNEFISKYGEPGTRKSIKGKDMGFWLLPGTTIRLLVSDAGAMITYSNPSHMGRNR